MKKNTKILLAVVGVLLLMGCLTCGAFIGITAYSAANAADPQFLEEAKTFGKRSDQFECEDHALEIAKDCGDMNIGCRARAQAFGSVCLRHAKASPKFCERLGLTDGDAISESIKGGMWSATECQKRGGGQACTSALNATVSFCATGQPK